jgi:spore coat polysaccharide biosynthesis protein SpsF (cytidylyltransferase family)
MSQLDFAIVICSRIGSRRLPRKILRKVNGKKVLNHLIDAVCKDFTVFVSVPVDEVVDYTDEFDISDDRYFLSCGSKSDPLARMLSTAETHDIKYVIRITHDKIFIDPSLIKKACDLVSKNSQIGYLYSSHLMDGCGFEIIRRDVLKYSSQNYGEVEHISYAARAACKDLKIKTHNFQDIPIHLQKLPGQNHRLLIDYPKDLDLIGKVLRELGNDCSVEQVMSYLNGKGCIFSRVNKLPMLTIYTCAYNAEEYLPQCINSVMSLTEFDQIEYIIVDDCSTDSTPDLIEELPTYYDNVKVITNKENLGLSSSCNIALENATSNYIMRLDADDYLVASSISRHISEISSTGADILTPSYVSGKDNYEVVPSRCNEHLGGSIFKASAVNHIKFTDGLRGYDNLDFFNRSKHILERRLSDLPALFFYRDTPNSLSKTDLDERAKLKEVILDSNK